VTATVNGRRHDAELTSEEDVDRWLESLRVDLIRAVRVGLQDVVGVER
jgi:hypothetical protein